MHAAQAGEIRILGVTLDADVAEFRMERAPGEFAIDPYANANACADSDIGGAINRPRRASRHFRQQRGVHVRVEDRRNVERGGEGRPEARAAPPRFWGSQYCSIVRRGRIDIDGSEAGDSKRGDVAPSRIRHILERRRSRCDRLFRTGRRDAGRFQQQSGAVRNAELESRTPGVNADDNALPGHSLAPKPGIYGFTIDCILFTTEREKRKAHKGADMVTDIAGAEKGRRHFLVLAVTFAMFFMFGMTTDAVGEIIRLARGELNLSNTQASAFHWATMSAIALSGIFLGFLADRLGHKRTIILGLSIYGIASVLFFAGKSFEVYVGLLFITGIAIGVFKTAALALIGDISSSTDDHTKKMNAVEGFFGVGAIIGPALVVSLDDNGLSWRWLYLFAAALCAAMIAAAMLTTYPKSARTTESKANVSRSLSLLGSPYALGFSLGIAMYVACEVAVFVWLPTFLDGFEGAGLAALFASYAVMIFFVLRAAGRFLGVWILDRFDWKLVILVFTGLIFACFSLSAVGGKSVAVFLLPFSGLFMSMIYPTLNSKGISCFPKPDHGAIAGLILFFTAVSAALAPLAMALVSDTFGGGDMRIGFMLATVFAGLLFAGAIANRMYDPAQRALAAANESEYK